MSSVGTSTDEEAQKLEDERADWTRRILVLAFLASTVALVIYHMESSNGPEKAGLSTAIYLIIQIVTTIGYGDITPTSDIHRVLISFYVILALVVLAYFLNNFVQMFTDREEELMAQVIAQAGGNIDDVHAAHSHDRLSGKRNQFLKSSLLFFSYIAFGTIFYANYEGCSCGYGPTRVGGCDESTYSKCAATGGQVKDYMEAFYFSVITLTTVGFGDFTPMTVVGRYIGIFWMLTGVAITANWVGQLTSLFLEHNEHANVKKLTQKMDALRDDIFEKLDYDSNDSLSRAEHHLYMLQKHGMLNNTTLAMLDGHFDMVDHKMAGQVTLEQIRERPNLGQS